MAVWQPQQCPRCTRPVWTALSSKPINMGECEGTSSPACRLAEQRNNLAAALRQVLLNPTDLLVHRTARAVLDYVTQPEELPMPPTEARPIGSDPSIQLPRITSADELAPPRPRRHGACPLCREFVTETPSGIVVHYPTSPRSSRPCDASFKPWAKAEELARSRR